MTANVFDVPGGASVALFNRPTRAFTDMTGKRFGEQALQEQQAVAKTNLALKPRLLAGPLNNPTQSSPNQGTPKMAKSHPYTGKLAFRPKAYTSTPTDRVGQTCMGESRGLEKEAALGGLIRGGLRGLGYIAPDLGRGIMNRWGGEATQATLKAKPRLPIGAIKAPAGRAAISQHYEDGVNAFSDNLRDSSFGKFWKGDRPALGPGGPIPDAAGAVPERTRGFRDYFDPTRTILGPETWLGMGADTAMSGYTGEDSSMGTTTGLLAALTRPMWRRGLANHRFQNAMAANPAQAADLKSGWQAKAMSQAESSQGPKWWTGNREAENMLGTFGARGALQTAAGAGLLGLAQEVVTPEGANFTQPLQTARRMADQQAQAAGFNSAEEMKYVLQETMGSPERRMSLMQKLRNNLNVRRG